MRTYIYIYICIHINKYNCIYENVIYIYIHIYICTCIDMYIYVCIYMYIYIYICICMCIYINMYVCMYVWFKNRYMFTRKTCYDFYQRHSLGPFFCHGIPVNGRLLHGIVSHLTRRITEQNSSLEIAGYHWVPKDDPC